MSPPTSSQTSAISLMNESLTARNELAAYLTNSAVSTLVTTSGTPFATLASYKDLIVAAARSVRTPATIRAGWMKSSTAEPWRKNSGLATKSNSMSGRVATISAAISSLVPTGTVDLITTVVPSSIVLAVATVAEVTAERSAAPVGPGGVATAINTTAAPGIASA